MIRTAGILLVCIALVPAWGCTNLGNWISTPSKPFSEIKPPPAPDYTNQKNWAALPEMQSRAKAVPPGVAPGDPALVEQVDVFFIHPTTYFWRGYWNAPPRGFVEAIITSVTLAGAASIFNGAGKIYAPRYRQLTLSGFDIPASRIGGLKVAYEDIRRAFQHYLTHYNEGRPIILAGHSQGSRLILPLLQEFFNQGELRDKLIAAYPVGTWVATDPDSQMAFGLPTCQHSSDTGCVATWRTYLEGSESAFTLPPEQKRVIDLCVNPLTWTTDSKPAPRSANLGSLPVPMFGLTRPTKGLVGGRCKEGVFYINKPDGWLYSMVSAEGSYHASDFELFYVNVRLNAIERARAWLRKNEETHSTQNSLQTQEQSSAQ